MQIVHADIESARRRIAAAILEARHLARRTALAITEAEAAYMDFANAMHDLNGRIEGGQGAA